MLEDDEEGRKEGRNCVSTNMRLPLVAALALRTSICLDIQYEPNIPNTSVSHR